ncbi:hypothetical protein QC823_13945 [Halomonas vilamensis]|uniref:PepSY domain-containing protein n=1 Tax=Vreelandella vilamensis TaxID=531309 RepID=A0ABU1H6Z7_9GAMM|nr:hypothetical protein [Halomonas vilamensis]MDR5900083.1 hypothetical protein [Halomonas vilamensis]
MQKAQRFFRFGLLLVMVMGLSATQADDNAPWQSLHGEVRRGEVVPLESILDWLAAHYVGEVLEVEVERDGGYVEYKIKMLGEQGQLVVFEFDGHTGQLMEMEGVGIKAMQRKSE